MENKFKKLKDELISQNVCLEGFGAWLKTREDARRLGVSFVFEHLEDNGWGCYPHEKVWEKVYQSLCKIGININNFADYLLWKPEKGKSSAV